MEDNVAAMFEQQIDADTIAELTALAERIAIEDDRIKTATKQLSKDKITLEGLRSALSVALTQNNLKGLPMENGLNPTTRITTTIFKSAGVTDPDLFEWLKAHDLDGIIKPTVHWGTLSSSLKEFVDAGNELPEMFNKVDKPDIRMNGVSKFLANRSEAPADTK
jgi:hypothetical protein